MHTVFTVLFTLVITDQCFIYNLQYFIPCVYMELWMQVPHRSVTEKPSVALQKAALDLQKKNESYQLLSDSDGEEVYQIPTKVNVKYQ